MFYKAFNGEFGSVAEFFYAMLGRTGDVVAPRPVSRVSMAVVFVNAGIPGSYQHSDHPVTMCVKELIGGVQEVTLSRARFPVSNVEPID